MSNHENEKENEETKEGFGIETKAMSMIQKYEMMIKNKQNTTSPKTKKKMVKIPKGPAIVVGSDWEAKDTHKTTKSFSGSYGKEWEKKKTHTTNKAFVGTMGKDWKEEISVSVFNSSRMRSYQFEVMPSITIADLEDLVRSKENIENKEKVEVEFFKSGQRITEKNVEIKNLFAGSFSLRNCYLSMKEKTKVSGADIVVWEDEVDEGEEEKSTQEKFEEFKEVQVKAEDLAHSIEEEGVVEDDAEVSVNLTSGEVHTMENYCEMKMGLDMPLEEFNEMDFKKAIAEELGVSPKMINIQAVEGGSTWVVYSLSSFSVDRVIAFAEDVKEIAKKTIKGIFGKALKGLSKKINPKKMMNFGSKKVENLGTFFVEKMNLVKDHNVYDEKKDAFIYKIIKSIGKPKIFGSKSSKMQSFFKKEDQLIRKKIQEHVKAGKRSMVIKDICLVMKRSLMKNFKWDFEKDNVKLLYRACKDKYYDGVFQNNFKDDLHKSQKTDPGWYGSGVYFTSNPLYAFEYYKKGMYSGIGNSKNTITASYVACGKIFSDIKDKDKYYGKELEKGYDCHFVKVDENGYAQNNSSNELIYDEYVVRTNKRILPRYMITVEVTKTSFIWRDPNINNSENSAILKKLQNESRFNIFSVKEVSSVFDIIEKKKECSFYIITNGGNGGGQLCKDLRLNTYKNRNRVKSILVFCTWEGWTERLKDVDDCKVVMNQEGVYEFFEKGLIESGLKKEKKVTPDYVDLIKCVQSGDLLAVREFLKKDNIDVNVDTVVYSYMKFPIAPEGIKLKHLPGLNIVTALHIAVMCNRADIVKELLSHPEVDVNKEFRIASSGGEEYGEPSDILFRGNALHIACLHNFIDVVLVLLKRKDIDVLKMPVIENRQKPELPIIHAEEREHWVIAALLHKFMEDKGMFSTNQRCLNCKQKFSSIANFPQGVCNYHSGWLVNCCKHCPRAGGHGFWSCCGESNVNGGMDNFTGCKTGVHIPATIENDPTYQLPQWKEEWKGENGLYYVKKICNMHPTYHGDTSLNIHPCQHCPNKSDHEGYKNYSKSRNLKWI